MKDNDNNDAAAVAAALNGIIGLASPPLTRVTAALVMAGALMAPAMPPAARLAAHDAFQGVIALLRLAERRRTGGAVAAEEIERAEAAALDAIRACLVQAPNDADVADFCGVAARAAQRIAAEALP